MIEISYLDDDVEPQQDGPEETPPSAPSPPWRRWAVGGALAALLAGLLAIASFRTEPHDLHAGGLVGVGDVYTVRAEVGQAFLRVTEVTLVAPTADHDPAALFILEGRGWYPGVAATLAAEACDTGQVTTLGSWTVAGNGSFRFADTDPGGGTYLLTVDGLSSQPMRVLVGPNGQRVLGPLERGCPQLA